MTPPRIPARTPPAPPTTSSQDEQSAVNTRLSGRWLTLAHAGWIAFVLLDAAIFVTGVPLYYRAVHIPCTSAIPHRDCGQGQLSPNAVQALRHLGISLDTYAALTLAIVVAASLVLFAVGGLIAWRKWREGMGLFVSLVLITFGAIGTSVALLGATAQMWLQPHLGPLWSYTLLGIGVGIIFAQSLAYGAFLVTFPTGRFTPRWSWLLIGLWITTFLAFVLAVPQLVTVTSVVITYGSVVAVQVYRYRRIYGPVERQQTKWLVLSIAVNVGVQIVYAVFLALVAGLGTSDSAFSAIVNTLINSLVSAAIFLLLPVAIAIALLRYRLYDIDVIIRRTLVYGTLTVLLAAVYFGGVIGLQALVGIVNSAASHSPVIIVASTLLIAALFNPLRRRLQATIDRRFYRPKYDAARTLAAFGTTLRTETDLEALSAHLVGVVQETMQPAHVSLWLRPPQRTEQTQARQPWRAAVQTSGRALAAEVEIQEAPTSNLMITQGGGA